ncbi:urease accessory protein UreD [Pontibaca methylaminivorans]|uniref:Urease accessory protein UreD n=1 Tax=Pontibaca methylaminivorans TaxID=515897 RepID=A0A1R3WWA7_9RHOB|nr:urease accessory protein UreD [Pontibaca methylaminivorans]SIT82710.1 Urease accessory protein UreH [Pontibaca methylaminivorans]
MAFDRILPDPKWEIGKHALMNLHVSLDDGCSRMQPLSWRIPYQWQGAHYQDNDDQPFLLLINSGGGFVEGDSANFHATLDPETRALITTTAASKYYKCLKGLPSRENVNIRVGSGALLEYMPDEAIPFASSNVERNTLISLSHDSRFFGSDMISAGRIHYGSEGEAFEFDRLASEFRVDVDGETVVLDRLFAETPEETSDLRALWDGANHMMSIVAWGDFDGDCEDRVRERLNALQLVACGVSRPRDKLLTCRIMATETWQCHEALFQTWQELRPLLAGKAARPIRKC